MKCSKIIKRNYYNSDNQNIKRMQDTGEQTLFMYRKDDYSLWTSCSEEKKTSRVEEKTF